MNAMLKAHICIKPLEDERMINAGTVFPERSYGAIKPNPIYLAFKVFY